jgi:K(+)-stimulated pyrophosphate-energized sodium pump
MEGTGTPEYGKCVEISTKAALREMMLPGALTIVSPIIIGLLFGAEPLGGYMAGVCVSGVMWAIFQNNAGGAWDNAKKSFEAGVEINGEMTYKGSEAHKAAVTGDTVGDPFKDTSGPSMNILIKLTCLIGLVIAPILGDGHGQWDKEGEVWSTEAEAHVLESYPAERYDQEKVMEVIKDFFPTPYHYSTINSSDSKVHDNFKVEIDGAMKADDDVKVDDEYDL